MSQKQNKTRVFIVGLVIMVIAIIAIGLFLTWVIIQDGQKDKETTLLEPSQAYVIEHERADYDSLLFYLANFNDNKISVF